MEPFNDLRAFRYSLYDCLYRRSDALFELTDAILLAANAAVPSPVHLSLQAPHRRGWGRASTPRWIAGGSTSRGPAGPARHPLAGGGGPPVYAVDVSVWPRCDAETSPQRGFYYHPSRHSAGQPIVAGWAYQFVAQLNFLRESWTAPVDVERVPPAQDANALAAEQLAALLGRLEEGEAVPLFVFDAGYDPVKLQRALQGSRPCQILVRLRAGRRFYGDPSLCDPPEHTGRPRRHGPKMKCGGDPSTWPEPSAEHVCEDTGYGKVCVRAWSRMHPKVQNHEGRGSRGPLLIVVGTLLIPVEVERLPRGESRRREPRVLWLWWHGPEGTAPELGLIRRSYIRCFDLEHAFRFLKQSMGWASPRVRHPEQADRWSWLVVAACTSSSGWGALVWRTCGCRGRRRHEAGRLTPVRVHRVVSSLLGQLGTPAKPPKPCGRWPGRPKGKLSGRAKRYPAIKKSA